MPIQGDFSSYFNAVANTAGTYGPARPFVPASNSGQGFQAALASQMPTPIERATIYANDLEAQSVLDLGGDPAISENLASNGGPGLEGLFMTPGAAGASPDLNRILSMLGELLGYPQGTMPGLSSLSAYNQPYVPGLDTLNASKANQSRDRIPAEDLGALSARFESGPQGAAAVGYDRVGGTSYGIYQIASRTGTMNEFIGFLDGKAPDLASRLRAAGPADTGSRSGNMPTVWREIAAQDPVRFGKLQRDFIRSSHYEPALRMIKERTGLDLAGQNPILREILWSTAVQHGANGAADIFSTCANNVCANPSKDFPTGMIEEIYKRRGQRFGSSDDRTRAAVQARFAQEKQMALAQLDNMAIS